MLITNNWSQRYCLGTQISGRRILQHKTSPPALQVLYMPEIFTRKTFATMNAVTILGQTVYPLRRE